MFLVCVYYDNIDCDYQYLRNLSSQSSRGQCEAGGTTQISDMPNLATSSIDMLETLSEIIDPIFPAKREISCPNVPD